MPVPDEVIALALYAEEKRRAEHTNALIGSTGECIEPYEECADSCWRNDARAALSALEAAGWVCVPREPTIAMQEAVARIPIRVGLEYPTHIPTAYVKEILAALLTASNPKEKPDV